MRCHCSCCWYCALRIGRAAWSVVHQHHSTARLPGAAGGRCCWWECFALVSPAGGQARRAAGLGQGAALLSCQHSSSPASALHAAPRRAQAVHCLSCRHHCGRHRVVPCSSALHAHRLHQSGSLYQLIHATGTLIHATGTSPQAQASLWLQSCCLLPRTRTTLLARYSGASALVMLMRWVLGSAACKLSQPGHPCIYL